MFTHFLFYFKRLNFYRLATLKMHLPSLETLEFDGSEEFPAFVITVLFADGTTTSSVNVFLPDTTLDVPWKSFCLQSAAIYLEIQKKFDT